MTLNDFNKEEILGLIKTQLNTIKNGNDEYNGYGLEVAEEQHFMYEEALPKTIYITVKFLPATINFGQTILPITINALSEENALEICNTMLTEFALQYNMEFALNDTVRQFYNTPYVISNFNEISTGVRTLMSMSGTLQINKTSNPKKIYIVKTTELIELPVITSNLSFETQLDPQVFYNSSDITSSEVRAGTYTLTLVMYDMTNYFQDKVLGIVCKEFGTSIKDGFEIRIVWKDGHAVTLNVKLKMYNSEQNIGEMSVSSYVLTC